MGSDLLDASGIQAIFLKMPFQKPRCHLSAPSSGTSQMTLRARKTVALHSLVESSGTSPVRESGDKATRTFTSNEMEILSASEYSSDEDAGAVRDKTDISFARVDDLDTSLSDIEQLEGPSVDKEQKYLVFRSCLKSLLKLARCLNAIRLSYHVRKFF